MVQKYKSDLIRRAQRDLDNVITNFLVAGVIVKGKEQQVSDLKWGAEP